MFEPRSLSGGKQSCSEETNDKVEIQHRPCPDGRNMWAKGLPLELLLKIFSMVVVDEEGPIPFLCRAARVCRSWNDAASDSQFWREVDLDQGRITRVPRTLRWLVDNRLSRVTKLNLSFWMTLKSEDYVHLIYSCRELQSLDLSCTILSWSVIKALSTLPNLQDLNLTRAMNMITQLPVVLCFMLRCLGPRLRELKLSGNHIEDCVAFMNALMANCPNLTVLDLSLCTFSSSPNSLNIERLQRCCPKLRVLLLDDTNLSADEADEETVLASPGFPDLEELNIAGSYMTYDDDDVIVRLLKNSPKLRDLDVSKCIRVSDISLLMIPAEYLKNLQVSRCSYRLCAGIVEILDKWKHSLENVDFSGNRFPHDCLDQALELMAQHGTSLRSLNLVETSRVSRKAIRTLLTGCRQLTILDLTRANIHLPSCARRPYKGREELDELLKTLS